MALPSGTSIVSGLLAVAAFWLAIRLCGSVSGRPWFSVAARVAGAVVLVCLGALMVFYTAFGAEAH
jgi:hypothetical protein